MELQAQVVRVYFAIVGLLDLSLLVCTVVENGFKAKLWEGSHFSPELLPCGH
jgi:hypothetical protein